MLVDGPTRADIDCRVPKRVLLDSVNEGPLPSPSRGGPGQRPAV